MIGDFFNLPPVSTTPTPVVHLELRISPANFQKNSKQPYWWTQGLGGNWFMKKTRSRKSRDTVPLIRAGIRGWRGREQQRGRGTAVPTGAGPRPFGGGCLQTGLYRLRITASSAIWSTHRSNISYILFLGEKATNSWNFSDICNKSSDSSFYCFFSPKRKISQFRQSFAIYFMFTSTKMSYFLYFVSYLWLSQIFVGETF